jgi:hypothetical protein
MRSTLTELSARLATSASVPRAVDRQARGLPADGERVDQLRGRGGEVDHEQPVVRHLAAHAVLFDRVERVGDECELLVGRDRKVGRRPAIVLASGSVTTLRGASGSVPMSITCTLSRPGAASTTAPASRTASRRWHQHELALTCVGGRAGAAREGGQVERAESNEAHGVVSVVVFDGPAGRPS